MGQSRAACQEWPPEIQSMSAPSTSARAPACILARAAAYEPEFRDPLPCLPLLDLETWREVRRERTCCIHQKLSSNLLTVVQPNASCSQLENGASQLDS